MKNKYLGFFSGFFSMLIYTVYDDHKKWNEHKAKYPEYYKKSIQLPK